jgi:hypothetical protein
MISPADGALGLYGAVGDACAGRRFGFARRRADVAARFARHRGAGDDAVAASWCAGLLAETGLAVVAGPAVADGTPAPAPVDFPLYGAWLAGALRGLPPRTSDLIRWHREHDDGTGFPDALRWDGIPPDAAGVGVAHAFVAALEDPHEPRDPGEALFALMAESGRRFSVGLLRSFQAFLVGSGDGWDVPDDPAGVEPDAGEALALLAARIDAREPATEGRAERRAALAGALAERLGRDRTRAERLARLSVVGATAAHAAPIAGSVAGYADDAPLLRATAERHEDGPLEPLAAVVALAIAAEALAPAEASRLIGAAAGTQFDPDVARAYLSLLGAPT